MSIELLKSYSYAHIRLSKTFRVHIQFSESVKKDIIIELSKS